MPRLARRQVFQPHSIPGLCSRVIPGNAVPGTVLCFKTAIITSSPWRSSGNWSGLWRPVDPLSHDIRIHGLVIDSHGQQVGIVRWYAICICNSPPWTSMLPAELDTARPSRLRGSVSVLTASLPCSREAIETWRLPGQPYLECRGTWLMEGHQAAS